MRSCDDPFIRTLASLATDRREFLRRFALFGVAAIGGRPFPRTRLLRRFSDNPFTLGVASGDPLHDGVVLWTRLAVDPLAAGGGLPPESVRVAWEIAHDERFTRIARRGEVTARPASAHALHVEVDGLEPDRVYWYRFHAGGEVSVIGRTRTAPSANVPLDEFAFAFASCQNYEQGFFTALRHLSEEDIRLVVHLGDYIYENGAAEGRPRRHPPNEIRTLEDYRHRHALYRLDGDLQAAHAAAPWIVTWDDHEVDNNYAADRDERDTPRDEFLLRRAASYQAYREHLPLRNAATPRGPDLRLYRRFRFGPLLEINVLDGRQYRTDQPCGDGRQRRCEAAYDERATMLGATQEQWLLDGLAASTRRWNMLANQVPLAQIDNEPGDPASFSMDRWDGYVAARRRLLGFLGQQAARAPHNPVVITGDIHSNWVGELRTDFDDVRSPVVGVEFIGTSLSSGGDGSDMSDFGNRALAANPHLRFFNNQRGYVRCVVSPRHWRADYRVLDYVSRPGSPVATRASFVIENGRPGVTSV